MFKKILTLILVSMVPLIELRGAMPIAVSMGFDTGWKFVGALALCVAANMVPVPFIYFFARKVLEWGKDKSGIFGKFCTFCLERGHKGGEKLMKKAGKGLFLALFLFVGIPLPGTGAWTGTLAASILDMGFKKSVLAVVAGVLLAGIIMGVGSLIFKGLFF